MTGDRIAQLAVSTDGSLYAAGRFLLPLSTAYQTLARWDGKEWAPLPGDLSFPTRRQQGSVGVSAITAWQDGLVVSGGFSHAGSLEANRIARWGGTSWHALGEGLGPRMRWGLATKFEDDFTMGYRLWGGAATVLVGGAQRLFALGEFDRAGSVGVRGLACWDGVRWSNPERASPISINGPIWSLALLGTNLVTFGFFTAAGEATVNGWASWTGHAWHALAVPSPQGLIARAPMATDGARLWTFTGSSLPWIHQLVEWDGDAWNPVANTASLVTAVRGNALFFCGDGVMRWEEGEVTTVAPQPGSSVAALGFLPDGTLCAVARLARSPHATVCVSTGDDWQTLEGGWTLGAGPAVILEDGDALYVAGRFNGSQRPQAQRGASTSLFSVPIRLPQGVARWRQGRWEPLGSLGPPQSPFPGQVRCLVTWRGQLFAGGQFQQIGGVAARNIARWDGQQWHPLGRGVPGPVAALVAQGDHQYVGGQLSRAIGQSVSNLARWHWPSDLPEPPN